MRIAVYPGTFDPVTLGHLDIIERSSKMFDKIIVVVSNNISKTKMFTVEERMHMIEESINDAGLTNVEVVGYEGLVVDYANQIGALAIIRGLRAVTDYENELTMATANNFLNSSIETIFLVSKPKYSFVSSSAIKEIARYSGEFTKLVPSIIVPQIKEKLSKK